MLPCILCLCSVEASGSGAGAVVREIMNEVDENGDGKISFEEFLSAMKSSMRL